MHTMLTRPRWLLLILVAVLAACAAQPLPAGPVPTAAPSRPDPPAYLEQLTFRPQDATYFDLLDRELDLSDAELALLARNGFVLSDRIAFEDFSNAYAYIYWRDLPVLITTDAILHAVHKTYDDLLMLTEEAIFAQQLQHLLAGALIATQASATQNIDPDLAPLYTDLETYLSVPLALLADEVAPTPAVAQYVGLARDASAIGEVALFGNPRAVDFTLFLPRGHYTTSEALTRYFRAMSWLAQVDFRIVDYPAGSQQPVLNLDHLAASVLLRDALASSGERETWRQLDALFSALVGRSDNTTLDDLDRLLRDADIASAEAALHHPAPAQLLATIVGGDYGQQRISGQVLGASRGGATQPLPISFMLLGQRFAVDSYVMSNLVFDRLVVGGNKVERMLPSSLDVMYALGDDRALAHLAPELERYGYGASLQGMRERVDALAPDFWESSVYHRTLGALRPLGATTAAPAYPQAMRTAAWADKMLHTQLAAWAQLRHDNLLYVKQSTTAVPLCSYPSGYVEPYPEFYAAVQRYAEVGRTQFAALDLASLGPEGQDLRQKALDYYNNLGIIAGRLSAMALKELRLEEFTAEEAAFLENTAVRQAESFDTVCAGIIQREEWQGWYPSLFPFEDDTPALIADVHTSPGDGQNAQVLHAATGAPVGLIFIADTDEGPMAYIGPAFTYYEVVTQGPQPVRLTDEGWREQLAAGPPAPPAWTASFRLIPPTPVTPLLLPTALPGGPGQP